MELIINSPKYGKFTVLYDDEDYELIMGYTWGVSKSRIKNFTVSGRRSNKGKTHHTMHRLVLGISDTEDGLVVHIDGNVFNNKKSNLIYNKQSETEDHGDYCVMFVWSKNLGKHSVFFNTSDRENISKYRWNISKQKKTFYAYARDINRPTKLVSLHRLLMGFPKGIQVDHINHNGLDNRRDNLRLGTHTQNSMNKNIQSNNVSGFKGVSFDKQHKKYQAYIWVNKKKINGGFYNDKIDAAKKYNELAIKHHDKFALLNKIPNE